MSPLSSPSASQSSLGRASRPARGRGWSGWSRRGPGRRRGAAAVEFAVVAPVLFALCFMMIEFGRTMLVMQVLTNASRVGARTASMTGSTTTSVTTAARDYASAGSISNVTISVSPAPDTATAGTAITVTVSVPFNQVTWLPKTWKLGGKILTSSSVMRKEGYQ